MERWASEKDRKIVNTVSYKSLDIYGKFADISIHCRTLIIVILQFSLRFGISAWTAKSPPHQWLQLLHTVKNWKDFIVMEEGKHSAHVYGNTGYS